jgi:hypothetical protein
LLLNLDGDKMSYRITSQKQLRKEFWETFPELSKKKIVDHSGTGTMFPTDVRITFCNWVDYLQKSREISAKLAEVATID